MQIAPYEHVEKLVSAADFNIGLDFNGVPALHDGILDLVKADLLTFFYTGFEVFALEHLLHGHAGIELKDLIINFVNNEEDTYTEGGGLWTDHHHEEFNTRMYVVIFEGARITCDCHRLTELICAMRSSEEIYQIEVEDNLV